METKLKELVQTKLAAGIRRRMSSFKTNDREVFEYKKSVSEIRLGEEADKKFSKILHEEE